MDWSKGVTSSVGSKFIMAVTGLMLLGFVIAHLLGNLLLYAGPGAINAYAKGLHDLGPLLWVARLGLAAIFGLHVAFALRLAALNKAARPTEYAYQEPIDSTLASRTMLASGLFVLAFVVFHLAHFTLGWVSPGTHASALPLLDGMKDVHAMVVAGFSNVFVALAYIVSMVLLGFHLSHGISSVFQSLGWSTPRYRPLIRKVALGTCFAIVAANISLPLSVLTGIVDAERPAVTAEQGADQPGDK